MKASTESVTLTINRREGQELLNQLIELTGGTSMKLEAGELRCTSLGNLFQILSCNFDGVRVGK